MLCEGRNKAATMNRRSKRSSQAVIVPVMKLPWNRKVYPFPHPATEEL
jgi:hypothetical protein